MTRRNRHSPPPERLPLLPTIASLFNAHPSSIDASLLEHCRQSYLRRSFEHTLILDYFLTNCSNILSAPASLCIALHYLMLSRPDGRALLADYRKTHTPSITAALVSSPLSDAFFATLHAMLADGRFSTPLAS